MGQCANTLCDHPGVQPRVERPRRPYPHRRHQVSLEPDSRRPSPAPCAPPKATPLGSWGRERRACATGTAMVTRSSMPSDKRKARDDRARHVTTPREVKRPAHVRRPPAEMPTGPSGMSSAGPERYAVGGRPPAGARRAESVWSVAHKCDAPVEQRTPNLLDASRPVSLHIDMGAAQPRQNLSRVLGRHTWGIWRGCAGRRVLVSVGC